MSQSPHLAELITACFQAWKSAGIPFLVLRNYEQLPAATSNDVDILLEPKWLAQAELILHSAARRCGFVFHNRMEFASLVLCYFHPQTLEQVQIDLFTDLAWRGFDTLDASRVLKERVERGLFAVPNPAHEGILLLLGRLLQHGRVRDKYKTRIVESFKAAPQSATEELTKLFGPTLGHQLAERSIGGEWEAVESLTSTLRRALIFRGLTQRFFATSARLFKDSLRLVRRWCQPPGLSVVLLGADGSGKSTAGQALTQNLQNTFPPGKGLEVHWKPVVFFRKRRRASGGPVENPHGKPPRNPAASLFYFAVHWMEYFLGWPSQIRPVLFNGGLVLIDRYYYDFLVDPRRFRLRLPAGLMRTGIRMLKKPELVFLLDAPAEELQRRKQEVPLAETRRQVEAYGAVVARVANARTINATQPVPRVAEEMTRHVLEFLAHRQERRGVAE